MSEVLHSRVDDSVNFVHRTRDGAFEARYVRREERYFIAYLSSHSGCDKACRMCHLTQTGQTMMMPASMQEYLRQAKEVFAHYDTLAQPAETVNFNFMARGEPFENITVLALWRMLRIELDKLAAARKLIGKFNLSTIMPTVLNDKPLTDILGPYSPRTAIFYSLYSMKPDFRRRWLPRAMEPNRALDKLARWQQDTESEVVLHWAFIAGENDDDETIDEIVEAIRVRGLKARFNLVRYNPFSARQGQEPAEEVIQHCFARLSEGLGDPRSRIVPRVGFDVQASCGMFVNA